MVADTINGLELLPCCCHYWNVFIAVVLLRLLRLGEVLGSRVRLVRVKTLLLEAGILGDVIESFIDEILLFLLLLILEVLRVVLLVVIDIPYRRLRLHHHLVPIGQKELLVRI